jgi:hypothetical protein
MKDLQKQVFFYPGYRCTQTHLEAHSSFPAFICGAAGRARG